MLRTELQETYEIQDCEKYIVTEQTKSYNSSMIFETIATITNYTNCLVELDVQTSEYNYYVGLGDGYNQDLNKIAYGGAYSNRDNIFRTLSGTNSNIDCDNRLTSYYNLKFEKTGNTLKLYLNDVLINTSTDNSISDFKYLTIASWRSKTLKYKNLKIYPI